MSHSRTSALNDHVDHSFVFCLRNCTTGLCPEKRVRLLSHDLDLTKDHAISRGSFWFVFGCGDLLGWYWFCLQYVKKSRLTVRQAKRLRQDLRWTGVVLSSPHRCDVIGRGIQHARSRETRKGVGPDHLCVNQNGPCTTQRCVMEEERWKIS